MLKQRIITAVVLLAILLPALFWPSPLPFMAVALILIGAGTWEWGRLNGLAHAGALLLAGACLALCAASWNVVLLRAGVAGWPRIPRVLRLAAGVLALWLAWLAVARARVIGINFLLSLLVLVWVADIAAYAAGRAFGLKFTKNKLAPSISPGKSWEGVWGGMAGVLVLAVGWVMGDRALQADVPSLYTRLAAAGWWLLVIGAVFLAAMSVVGDLVESLIKRSAGVKDSSNLLPGHGGVLDRVDALLPALPLAMMLTTLTYR
jgi:phosphatidate cytidylyltransferase